MKRTTLLLDPALNTGSIQVLGQIWSAKSKTGAVISEGSRVEVVDLEGVKAVVVPIPNENII